MHDDNIDTNSNTKNFDPGSMLSESGTDNQQLETKKDAWDIVEYTIAHPDTKITTRARLFELVMDGPKVSKLVVSVDNVVIAKEPCTSSQFYVSLVSVKAGGIERVSVKDSQLVKVKYLREKYSEPVLVLKFS